MKEKEHKIKRHFFKDSYDHRKCTDCKGKGIGEEYTETEENNVKLKIITNRYKCETCDGKGIEKYIKKYAVFKNLKIDTPFPISLDFDIFSKHIRFSPRGWVSIFAWIARKIIWNLYLHKLFKKLKIPFEYYDINSHDIYFELLGFNYWGSDYMSEYCTIIFNVLGFELNIGWTPIMKYHNCTKCGMLTPILKGKKTKLCLDCEYPKERITIEPEIKKIN